MAQSAVVLEQEERQDRELTTVHVTAERAEARTYDRSEMDATPEGNRDLTSLISNHPAVRLDANMSGNGNRGSLAPESFSIHGESPYQNQYLIDGIGGSNVINPQESSLTLQVGKVPGFAQAYNIDTDLLDKVQVHDSRVPVEFGKFQGGVVDARIKTPVGSNKLSLKQSFNSSSLTRQYVPEGIQTEWSNGEPGYSAVWKKHFTSASGDFRLTQDTTALVSLSRRQSQIQRQSRVMDSGAAIPNGDTTSLQLRDASDNVDNVMAKLHTQWGGGTTSSLVLKYADRQETLVSNSYVDTTWINRQKAMGLGFDITQQLQSGKLTATLGVDQLDASRDSGLSTFLVQNFADKNLRSFSRVGFGNEALEQHQYTAKLRMDWDSFKTGVVQHKAYAGVQLQSTNASFVRDRNAYAINQTQQLNGQQDIKTRTLYAAGSVGVDYNNLGLYASDTMQLGNWALTTAVRLDQDDFLKNSNLAPRAKLDWDVFGDGRTQLGLGWARYFGQDMLGYALAEGKSTLVTYEIQGGKLTNKPGAVQGSRFDGLKTPHSDEWALMATHQLTPMWEGGFSYVRRASRNGLMQTGSSSAGYVYLNNAQSDTETATLSLRPLKPWKAAGADWTGRMDFSWQSVVRNHDTILGWETVEEAPDDTIEVNDVQMLRSAKPASGFNVPRKLSATVNARWAKQGVNWGNRVNWNGSRTGIAFIGKYNSGANKGMQRYASQRLSSYLTWDTSISYQPGWAKGMTLSLDILNVLDKQVPLAIGSAAAANNVRYKTGREIWLTAGYEF